MDLLTAGPERVRPPRRRWVAAAVAVAVAGTAVVLAARSNPDRPQVAPTAAPTATAPPASPAVIAVAVGRRWAYALVVRCDTGSPCGYDLRRRELAGGPWSPTPLRTSRIDPSGRGPFLRVTDDLVTVVDQPDAGGVVLVSADGGGTVQTRPLRPAAPVDAVPPDGVLDLQLCASCARRLAVLSPRDGELHELTAQPPVGPEGLRTIGVAGPTIWVASTGVRGEVVTAVSADAGRSWRAVPARGFPTGVENLRVSAGPDGSAYLLGARVSPAGLGPLAEVWHVAGPTGTWRKLPVRPGPEGPVSVVPDGADAVLTDYLGQAWRLRPDGTVVRLSDAYVDGRDVGPGLLATGPGALLLGQPFGEGSDLVLVSTDRGRSWTAERILA